MCQLCTSQPHSLADDVAINFLDREPFIELSSDNRLLTSSVKLLSPSFNGLLVPFCEYSPNVVLTVKLALLQYIASHQIDLKSPEFHGGDMPIQGRAYSLGRKPSYRLHAG